MKKSRLIALTLVVTMMLMGTAYAAWTQTITVDATVATGELKFTVTEFTPTGHIYYSGSPEDIAASKLEATADLAAVTGGVDASTPLSIDGSTITVSGSKFFPGTEQRNEFYIKNDGTIPMDIKLVTTSSDVDMPEASVKYVLESRMNNIYNPLILRTEEYGGKLEDVINNHDGLTLQPGEVAHYYMRCIFNSNDYYDQSNSIAHELKLVEGYEYSYDFDIVASQFNID